MIQADADDPRQLNVLTPEGIEEDVSQTKFSSLIPRIQSHMDSHPGQIYLRAANMDERDKWANCLNASIR